MVIGIYESKTIRDLQLEFAEFYPFLKIELYEQPFESKEWQPGQKQFPINRTIAEVKSGEGPAYFEIHPGATTAELEASFQQLFGIPVRFFRLEADTWQPIPLNETKTLEEQNEAGKTASENLLNKNKITGC